MEKCANKKALSKKTKDPEEPTLPPALPTWKLLRRSILYLRIFAYFRIVGLRRHKDAIEGIPSPSFLLVLRTLPDGGSRWTP
jgi:hypothetical protein